MAGAGVKTGRLTELLGTGSTTPRAPTPSRGEYDAWLESERGFQRETLQTDYAFAEEATAVRVMGAFFGAELGARIQTEKRSRVPEVHGAWVAPPLSPVEVRLGPCRSASVPALVLSLERFGELLGEYGLGEKKVRPQALESAGGGRSPQRADPNQDGLREAGA